jgi:hypothetical protein
MLFVVAKLIAPQPDAAARAWAWLMLMAVLVATLPWPTVAETISPALSDPPEAGSRASRQGVATKDSNLRASPFMHSEIMAVAKEGARLQVLLESGRWLRVRNEEGIEAWIYKSLVRLEQEPEQSPSETLVVADPLDLAPTIPTAAGTLSVSAAPPPPFILEQPGLENRSAGHLTQPHVLPHTTWIAWAHAIWLFHLQKLGGYLVIALITLLALSIVLQRRAARRLRWTMQEVGQLLDLVEEVYTGRVMGPSRDSGASVNPLTGPALAQKSPPPGIEFSAVEDAVLQALSDQPEVQEAELGKFLAERGFAGVLVKAVIGDIVRKTGTLGLPWVAVRYVGGRYRYRLRSDAGSYPANYRLEGR